MDSFSISIPIAHEAALAFKTTSDVFSAVEKDNQKINQIADGQAQFSIPITLGAFRLLLDGEFNVVDVDFTNFVALYTMTSKDRGGKGRLDGKFRLSLNEVGSNTFIECVAQMTPRGMIARVDLPIDQVLGARIEELIYKQIEDSQSKLAVVGEPQINTVAKEDTNFFAGKTVPVDLELLLGEDDLEDKDSGSEDPKRPLWVNVLCFPVKLIAYPFNIVRSLFTK